MERGSCLYAGEYAISFPVTEFFPLHDDCRTFVYVNPAGNPGLAGSPDASSGFLLPLPVAPEEAVLQSESFPGFRVDELVDMLVADPHTRIVRMVIFDRSGNNVRTPSFYGQSFDNVFEYLRILHGGFPSLPLPPRPGLVAGGIRKVIIIFGGLVLLGILSPDGRPVAFQLPGDGSFAPPENDRYVFLKRSRRQELENNFSFIVRNMSILFHGNGGLGCFVNLSYRFF